MCCVLSRPCYPQRDWLFFDNNPTYHSPDSLGHCWVPLYLVARKMLCWSLQYRTIQGTQTIQPMCQIHSHT